MRLIDTSSFTEMSLKGLILTSNSKSTKGFAQFPTINKKLKNLTEKNWSAAATGGCLIKHREDSSYLLSLFINNTFTFHQQHFHFSSAVLSINSTFTFHQLRTLIFIFFCHILSLSGTRVQVSKECYSALYFTLVSLAIPLPPLPHPPNDNFLPLENNY